MLKINLITLFLLFSCSAFDKEGKRLGPPLEELGPKASVKENPKKKEAFGYLLSKRNQISTMDFEDEISRLTTPEEVKFKEKVINLKKGYNNTVRAYEGIKVDGDGYQEYVTNRNKLEAQIEFLILHHGV